MTTTITPCRSARQPGADGFFQLLRAEWTKFRTVRGWVVGLFAVAALTAVLPIWLASAATNNDAITCVGGQCQVEGQNFATGPGGTAVIDSFYFVHQPMTGNGSITVRVTSFHGSGPAPSVPPGAAQPPKTQPWAKAGLIIKNGTRPGSAYAAVMVTGAHGVRMQYNFTHDAAGSTAAVSPSSPQWLRLTRSGNLITGYDSANGRQWTTIGTANLAGLPATAQAGLFVASPGFSVPMGTGDSTDDGPTRATASFDHLRLQQASPGQAWAGTVVGSGTGGVPVRLPAPTAAHHKKCCKSRQPAQGYLVRDGSVTVQGSGDIAPFVPITDPLSVTYYGTLFGLIAVIALGALFITTEYRRGLIRTTMTASPRRGRIVLAKAIVVGAVTFAASLLGAAIAFPIVERKLTANGWKAPVWPELSVFSSTGLQIVLGTAAIAAGAAVLGLASGVLFRRSASAVMAVIGVVVLPLVLATILLPLTVAQWVLRITPAAAFSLMQATPHYSQVSHVCAPYHSCLPLEPWPGFAVMAAWAVLALAGAVYLLRRRDA